MCSGEDERYSADKEAARQKKSKSGVVKACNTHRFDRLVDLQSGARLAHCCIRQRPKGHARGSRALTLHYTSNDRGGS